MREFHKCTRLVRPFLFNIKYIHFNAIKSNQKNIFFSEIVIAKSPHFKSKYKNNRETQKKKSRRQLIFCNEKLTAQIMFGLRKHINTN